MWLVTKIRMGMDSLLELIARARQLLDYMGVPEEYCTGYLGLLARSLTTSEKVGEYLDQYPDQRDLVPKLQAYLQVALEGRTTDLAEEDKKIADIAAELAERLGSGVPRFPFPRTLTETLSGDPLQPSIMKDLERAALSLQGF